MKPLSQVLDAMPTNAEARNRGSWPIPQHGSTRDDGMMLPALTEIRSMAENQTATPEKIDNSLRAALTSLPNSSVSFRKISVTHEEHGFLRTRDVPTITTANPSNLKELYRAVESVCMPCPRDDIAKELYGMSLGMARRKDQDLDFKMMLAVYAGDLAEYPRDVIVDACREVRRESRFFPTIADLRDECESRFEFRRALRRELEIAMSGVRLLGAG